MGQEPTEEELKHLQKGLDALRVREAQERMAKLVQQARVIDTPEKAYPYFLMAVSLLKEVSGLYEYDRVPRELFDSIDSFLEQVGQ